MWFTEYGADRIGRIAPDGTITEFSAGITPPSGAAAELGFASPTDIVTGPDGNLWFTEQFADRIGRITPDGVITQFAAGITPSPANDIYPDPHQYQPVSPTRLTTGPDGNVWFVEQMANRVGRITPDGTITEFAVPVDPSTFHFSGGSLGFRIIYLNAITPGADGNLWFTADGAGDPIPGNSLASGIGAVGRITSSGEITLFAEGLSQGPTENVEGLPPNPQPAGLRGITEGPFKSFWALSSQGLVRVTRAGKITELPVEIEIGVRGAERLVPGPHGTLWFAESGNISRVTLSCG
jgi:virginiamycin B lyase